jgi:hypothetical protein
MTTTPSLPALLTQIAARAAALRLDLTRPVPMATVDALERAVAAAERGDVAAGQAALAEAT